MRLHHVDTGGYLHSHDKKYTRIAGGQQEVSATYIANLALYRDDLYLLSCTLKNPKAKCPFSLNLPFLDSFFAYSAGLCCSGEAP